MNNYIFYAHAGSGNHGCEAIVRASSQILQNKIKLFSANPDQDKQYGLEEVVASIEKEEDKHLTKFSLPWLLSRTQTKLTKSIDKEIYYRKKQVFAQVRQGDIWFSIGGDNYCYPGTDVLSAERNIIQSRGGKAVLWGCSIEPKLLENKELAKDLAAYDLITARESLSYKALKEVNSNTVLVSDPAFTLSSIKLSLPAGWMKNNMVGINVSPLVMESASSNSIVLNAYRYLIEKIICDTGLGIALIPHVVWENNNDLDPLRLLYKEYQETGKVILIEDLNCMELKGYIARCRFFIGARTHATIAAYSSGVPTLALGYSIKSKGIAKDLMGTYNDFVIPVQQLNDYKDLADMFQWICQNEGNIKSHLSDTIKSYSNKSYLGKEAVKQLL